MAENGNRGPNDFRARNAKRRREPPIIDASAAEVPIEPGEPTVEAPAAAPVGATADAADAPPLTGGAPPADEAEPLVTPETAEPVLFGSARRDPTVRSERVDPVTVTAGHGADSAAAVPVAGEEPLITSTAEPDLDGDRAPAGELPRDPPSSFPAGTGGGAVPPAYASPPPARAAGNVASWVLGLCSLALLAALVWVLFTEPQRGGRDEIADLRGRVAALEARPDPAKGQSDVQAGVAALEKRLAAADADRAAIGKTVSDLSTHLDAVAQQAQAAQQSAQAESAKPASPEPAPAPAEPAPSGAAAAATVGALAILAGKLDGLDGRVADLATAQGQTAKAVADAPKPIAPDFGPVEATVSALDGRVAGLDGRIAAIDGKVNGSDARLNGFDAKVNAVDGKTNGVDARMNGFESRTNGLESKVDGTANDVTKLQATVAAKADAAADDLGKLQATVANLPHVDLGPLQVATAALGGRMVAIEDRLAASKDGARVTEARAVGSADEARAAPIALVGEAVQRAIADGRPYASDLESLKTLGVKPEAVAKLSPSAAGGAPSAAALHAGWAAVAGDVAAALKPAEPSSAFDRLTASARSLVQVRRVGAVQGEDPAALLSQIDGALATGDVTGALAVWAKLPAAGKDRSQDWAAAARARVDAVSAAQDIVDRAIASLGPTKS